MIPVAFDLRDPVRSGIARVARSLARAFAEQSRGRFRITLAGPRRQLEGLGAQSWAPDVAAIVNWPAGRYSLRSQRDWRRVRQEVGEATWYFPHWDVPWYAMPDASVVTLHDLGGLHPGVVPWHRGLIARVWMRHALASATGVTTGTEFTCREIVARWPDVATKISVIPHGIDPAFFERADLPGDLVPLLARGPFMLSVGNLKRHKNLIMGVEVLARLPNIHWIVVGEWFPAWRDVERHAASLGVLDRLSYLGAASDEVVHALYHRAACLFFPSRHEGFGLPLLEALAAGTPVVAGNYGAVVETLGGFGWTCDPDSPEQFADAVRAAVGAGNEARAQRVAHARRFSWQQSASRLADMVQRIHAAA